MAVSLHKTGVEQLIWDRTGIIFNNMTKGFQNENLLSQLRSRESVLLNQKFGVTSMTELRKRLDDVKAKAPMLNQLNGVGLRKIIESFQFKAGNKNVVEQKYFKDFLQAELKTIIGQEITDDTIISGEQLETYLKSLVNDTFIKASSTSQGRVQALTSLRGKEFKLDDIILNRLAPRTQERLKQILQLKYPQYNWDKNVKTNYNPQSGELYHDVTIDWYVFSEGKRASGLNLTDNEIAERNEQFIQQFLQTFNFNNEIPKLEEILRYMTTKYPKMLFVGESGTQIEGILGEIQTLCFLSLLMPKNFSLSGAHKVNWTARELVGGKQSHDDIILDKFGIQVKNSYQVLNNITLDFVKSSLSTFLQNLERRNIIDQETADHIQNVYDAYYFNIPYTITHTGSRSNKKNTRKINIMKGDNPKFSALREKIELLHAALEQTLNRLVGILMYIGVGNAYKNQPSNILFFVRGEIFAASEILENVLSQLAIFSNNMPFSFNVSTFAGNNTTIIDKIKEDPAKNLDSIGSNQLLYNIPNVQIRSSFNFGWLKDLIEFEKS